MSNYIFIETRDPFESRDTQFLVETATALKERGHDVTVFLVQNGVLAARRAARASHLPPLAEAGVRLLADDFSLAERGIGERELLPGVRQAGVESLVDFLAGDDTKAIWH